MNLLEAPIEIQLLKPSWRKRHKPEVAQSTAHTTQTQVDHKRKSVKIIRAYVSHVSGSHEGHSEHVVEVLAHEDEREACTVGR